MSLVRNLARRLYLERALWQLPTAGPAGQLLREPLRATIQQRFDAQEQVWIDRIEARRAALYASEDEIVMTNYGVLDGQEITRTVGYVSRNSSKTLFWTLLLLRLVRALRPTTCLEMGACAGVSGAYQAAALQLNGAGRLVTLEGAGSLAALSRETFAALGLENVQVVEGRFQDTLATVVEEIAPIDYAFIDGHHEEEPTLAYLDQIYPHLASRALLVFDDIYWTDGMRRAWNRIQSDPRMTVSADLRQVGLCLVEK